NRENSTAHGVQNHSCGPAFHRHFPELALLRSDPVVKKLTIHGLHSDSPAILGHLDLRTSVGADFPDLETTGSSRAEVAPLSCAGPIRDRVAQRMSCQAARLTTCHIDHIDVPISSHVAVERDGASIGRPPRAAGHALAEVG